VPQVSQLIHVSILATIVASIFFGSSAAAVQPTWHVLVVEMAVGPDRLFRMRILLLGDRDETNLISSRIETEII